LTTVHKSPNTRLTRLTLFVHNRSACFEDEKTKLVMTPGRDCRSATPGKFRICCAAVKREALVVAASRLVDLLGRYR